MVVSDLQLFRILKDKLGEKEAEELIYFVKSEVNEGFEMRRDVLATKQDLHELENRLVRSIFITGLVQFLALIGSLLVINNYTLK